MARLVRFAAVTIALCFSPLALPAPAQAADWDLVDSACHDDGTEGWTFYTWCWGKKKRLNDGNGDKDIYAFKMTSSGNSTDGKYLDRLWVEPDPRETSPNMVWHGTDPFKPDHTISTNTNCVGWEMTIGGGPVPAAFSVNGQVCDTESFGPKLYAEDGHHAGVWNDSNCVPSGTVRKVTSLVLVRVNQGKLPLWSSERRGADAYSSRESC